ncbi:hypothetical protein Q5752_005310 [Cryptotrichosporon argae]
MSQRAVSNSYHPHGFDSSASLQRARRPYYVRNIATGTAILAFILGVYGYSIAAVKQDDFSDVADLLPPESERQHIRTIEDELRDKALGLPAAGVAPYHTSSPSAPSKALPAESTTSGPVAASTSGAGWGWRRLGESAWLRTRGWVDEKGNAVVWGAPDVDRVGGLWDAGVKRGPRLV